MRPLRIGTRASVLARWQAENVRTQLGEIGVPAELVLIRTSGDRKGQAPLRAVGGKGIFIKEIEDALLEGRVDLGVHSMKDVPTKLPDGLRISAVCRRDDVRDALVSRDALLFENLPQGARVGTSSLRRQAQLGIRRPDLRMVEIRGNVETRLAKVTRGECDAVVLAKAGLDRLGLGDRISEVLTTEMCLPAAGQGAIGIETRARDDDDEVLESVRKLNHLDTQIAVQSERAVLAGLEGGCQVPVGVWAREENGELVLEACVLAADGSEWIRIRRAGMPQDGEELGREMAAGLLARGASRLLQLAPQSPAGRDIARQRQ